LLNPDPSRRLTAEQALTHSCVTSFAAPTEHDLSGLRENFDPRARWCNAIRAAARVLSRFGNHKGANNHKDKSVVSSDHEDDDGGGGSTSWRATPKTDNNRPQQQLTPSSPDDRVPRRGLAGLVAAGGNKAN
jgi:calcium/calmodulin-dependent protein kinase I